jgi:splicing factor 1
MVRKSRWGPENEKVQIYGLPTSLPSDISNEQIENYIIHFRIEEISKTLRTGNYVPRIKRSVSPPPTYGPDGRRNNTREQRYREKLEAEQHSLVEYGMKNILGFRPPLDYKRAQRVQEKVYIPQDDHPDINFIGLLIGPRGNTLKKMEAETGTKISIRGKGSVKEGKIKSESSRQAGDDDYLHALVSGDCEDRVKACITMILKVIEQAASVPEGQNELKRQQLVELARLNGTIRDEENKICSNCGGAGHERYNCPEIANFTTTIVCKICNSIGHLARGNFLLIKIVCKETILAY